MRKLGAGFLGRGLSCFVALLGCLTDARDETRLQAPVPPASIASLSACELAEGSAPDSAPAFTARLGCMADYQALASEPADASIPGATSVKVVIDRAQHNRLYFQNSRRYCVHWDFVSQWLSGGQLPSVPALAQFNATEYYSPDRRFILGALSHYSGPDSWVFELSPYDTADAELTQIAFDAVRAGTWLGPELSFHPTSARLEVLATELRSDIAITSSDALFQGIDYQALNTGSSTGILRFRSAQEVDGAYTPYREIVVLDAVPNDISIVAGIITSEFQTPLAHINVLSVNRGTPNMALRGAQQSERLRALEGQWVELTVGPFGWDIRGIGVEAASAWWSEHAPQPLTVQPMELGATDLREISAVLDPSDTNLGRAIARAIPSFGAKATNYGALARAQAARAFVGLPAVDGDGPIAPAFAVPMFYYDQFMRENGLYARIEQRMSEPDWQDPALRAGALRAFKRELRAAPLRPELVQAVIERAAQLFPGENIRFRSSTNAEDLGTFTGAGLYDSETGQPALSGDQQDSVEWAIKKVWSQVWNPRAYEEREYFSMRHLDVGMALLVHANFPEEESQGVALTNNPFDTSGLEPAFFVNGQLGSSDVVTPERGVLPEAYLQYFRSPGQPIVYTQRSSLVPEGGSVLSPQQAYRLGFALDAIHRYFAPAYGSSGWYALEVDWKFDDKRQAGEPSLFIKQARPYPRPVSPSAGGCGG